MIFRTEQVPFEWVEGEERFRQGMLPSAAHRRNWPYRLAAGLRGWPLVAARGLVLLLITFIAATGATTSAEDIRQALVSEEIYAAVQHESYLWRSGGPWFEGDLLGPESQIQFDEGLLDPQADFRWRKGMESLWIKHLRAADLSLFSPDLQHVRLHGDIAIAQVQVTPATSSTWPIYPFIQYRFYRKHDGQWLQTFPPASFWGAELVLETAHLRLVYHEVDATVVEAIAPRLESTYLYMARLVGADPLPEEKKTKIYFSPHLYPDLRVSAHHITVPSYLLSFRAVGTTAEDGLLFTTSQLLATLTVGQVQGSYKAAYPLMNGFMVSSLHEWLVENATGTRSPGQQQAEHFLQSHLQRHFTVGLERKTQPMHLLPQPDTWLAMGLAGKYLIDYALETYGSDALPVLVRNLASHNSWNTLVPATFGVTQQTFEAGWNQYMLHRIDKHGHPEIHAKP